MARTVSPETDLVGEDVLVLWRPVAVGNSELSDPEPCVEASLSILGFGLGAEIPAPGGGFYAAPNGFIRRWSEATKYIDGSGIEYWAFRTQALPANLDGTAAVDDPGYRALPIEGTAYRIAGRYNGSPFSFTFEIDAAADYTPEYEDGAIPVEVIAVDGTSFVGTPSNRFALSVDAVLSITAGNASGTVDHPSAGNYVVNFPTSLDDFDPPTATVDMGGQRITNLDDPTLDSDAVSRSYLTTSILDALDGLVWKDACWVATTSNIDLVSAPATIDGIALNPAAPASERRVLVKEQTDPVENGIYEWSDVGDPLVRTSDVDNGTELRGASTFVIDGTTLGDTQWSQTLSAATVGTSPIGWVQIGALVSYAAQAGGHLALAGNEFYLVDGPGSGVDADTLDGLQASEFMTSYDIDLVRLPRPTYSIGGSTAVVPGEVILADFATLEDFGLAYTPVTIGEEVQLSISGSVRFFSSRYSNSAWEWIEI